MRDVRKTGGGGRGGGGCVGGQEKEWMGWSVCLLDDPRVFGIDTDQWTTAAQDEGEWRNVSWQNGSLQRKPVLDYGVQ